MSKSIDDVGEELAEAEWLIRELTITLEGEHASNCKCGSPSEGDCGTRMIIDIAQSHMRSYDDDD